MADGNTALEQVSIATTEPTTEAARRRARAAARKDQVARYLAGDSLPSNFEAMVRVLERDPNAGAEPCDDCHGLGHRQLAPHVTAQYDERLEHQLAEIEHKEGLLREAHEEATKPRKLDDAQEAFRKDATEEVERLSAELVTKYEAIDKRRRERLKRAICRTCKGSGKSRRRRREDRPGRPDSMFSTVTCPGCTGRDARKHGSLLTAHAGTGCGTRRLHGPAFYEYDPADRDAYTVVSDKRDDAAAELGDACRRCLGEDGLGTGYVVPVTARPTLRSSDVEEDLELQQVKAIQLDGVTEEVKVMRLDGRDVSELDHYPADDFVRPSEDPAELFLDALAAEDPVLAAAAALLAGDRAELECVLWPLTSPGRALAEESAAEVEGTGYARLLGLCEAELAADRDGNRGSPRRRLLIGYARRAAQSLRDRVEARLSA